MDRKRSDRRARASPVRSTSLTAQQLYGGNEIGHGLADVLFGRVNPSGKLPVTFPVQVEHAASHSNFGRRSQQAGTVAFAEGILSGYRHSDAHRIEPLFAFGHGLSYTTFVFSSLETDDCTADGDLTLRFEIANTGSRAGSETAQVFVSAVKPRVLRPVKELKAFAKAALEPGERRSISVDLDREAFSYWSKPDDAWRVDAGEYIIHVGPSSASLPLSTSIRVPRSFTWRGL